MPESKSPESKSGGGSSKAQLVVNEAMKYVNRGNPYCWAGWGQELTDANVNALINDHPEQASAGWYDHLKPGGSWYDKVNQPGMECVDCSGMTRQVFQRAAGIDVGAGTVGQRDYGPDVGVDNALPGDLLVNSHHAAIMGDNGKIIEAQWEPTGCVNNRTPYDTDSTYKCMRVVDGGASVTSGGSATPATSGGSTSASGSLLTQAQIDTAINYNRTYNQAICMKIQGLVGVEQDNSFGPITVGAIAKWQQSKGLEVDGIFGPISTAAAEADGWTTVPSTTATPATTTPEPATTTPEPATTTPAPAATTTAGSTSTRKLTDDEIETAIKYNRTYNQGICIKIQALVGVDQDNSFGPITVQAIADWQASKGLEIDGIFGPISTATAEADGWSATSGAPTTSTEPATTTETKPTETKPEDTTPITTDPGDYTGTDEVLYGQSNDKVKTLQKLLNKHNVGVYGSIGEDGDFGKQTATALMRFQYFYVKKTTDVAQFFADCYSNGKRSVCDAETWNKLRLSSPSYTSEKGKPIAFNYNTGQQMEYTPADIKGANGNVIGKLCSQAAPHFNEMAKDSVAEGNGVGIQSLGSSFRGMTYEATNAVTGGSDKEDGAIELYVDRGFSPNDAAIPGYSYHCSGNAVDISGIPMDGWTPLYQWLCDNAYKYGFKGFWYEHWHWYYE